MKHSIENELSLTIRRKRKKFSMCLKFDMDLYQETENNVLVKYNLFGIVLFENKKKNLRIFTKHLVLRIW